MNPAVLTELPDLAYLRLWHGCAGGWKNKERVRKSCRLCCTGLLSRIDSGGRSVAAQPGGHPVVAGGRLKGEFDHLSFPETLL